MTIGGKFGYLPHPIPPQDFHEFLQYKNGLLRMYQERLFQPRIKRDEVREHKLKSTTKYNVKLRDRNGNK